MTSSSDARARLGAVRETMRHLRQGPKVIRESVRKGGLPIGSECETLPA